MSKASKRAGNKNRASGPNPALAAALPHLRHRAGPIDSARRRRIPRAAQLRRSLRDQQD